MLIARCVSRFGVLVTVGLLLVCGAICKRFNTVAGPWTSSVIDVTHCPLGRSNTLHTLVLDVVGYYNTSAKHKKFKGNVHYVKALERNKLDVQVTMAKWDSVGGWKNNFFIMKLGEPCMIIETTGKQLWQDFSNNTTPHVSMRCPILKGSHALEDWDVTRTLDAFSVVPVIQYGRYKAQFSFQDISTRTEAFCTEAIFDMLPKEY